MWVDLETIPPAADWRDRIGEGIQASKALLFVLSPDAIESVVCRDELDQAVAMHKLVVPVLRRTVDGLGVPSELRRRNWIRLREEDDFEAGIASVLEALEDDLEWRDLHARLAVRSQEWVEAGLDRSFLLQGRDLDHAERWLAEEAQHRERATRDHVRYVQASRAAADRRRRRLVATGVTVLAGLVALAAFGVVQLIRSGESERLALSRQLRSEVDAIARRQPDAALLVGLQSLRFAPDKSALEARAALLPGFAGARHPASQVVAHLRGAETIAFARDSGTLFSSGEDGMVRVSRVGAGEPVREWRSGQSEVVTLAASPDGRQLATVGAGVEVRLWDAMTGKLLRRLRGHSGFAVVDAAYSPDGSVLASVGSEDQTVRLWSPRSGRLLGSIAPASAAAFSPDGKTLAVGGPDGRVRLWRVADATPLTEAFGSGGFSVNDLAFSPDGSVLASAHGEPAVRLWNVAARRQAATLRAPDRTPLFSVAISARDGTLAAGGENGRVYRWTAARERLGDPLRGQTGLVQAVAFSRDGALLAAASVDGSVRAWRLDSGVELGTPAGRHRGAVRAVATAPDGRTVLSGGDDGRLLLADVAGRGALTRLGPFTAADEGGTRIAAGVAVFASRAPLSIDNAGTLRAGPRVLGDVGPVWSAAFSADGRRVATQGWPSGQAHGQGAGDPDDSWIVHVRDTADGAPVADPFRQEGGVRALALSANGRLALAGNEGTVTIAGADGGGGSIAAGGPVDALAFSADGARVATGGSDGAVGVWDVRSRRRVRSPLRGHDGSVLAVALAPNGRWVASGGDDGTVRLWDVGAGFGFALPGLHGPVRAVAFSADGHVLAAGDDDGAVRAWDLRLSTWVQRACALANRNLTQQEWDRWIGSDVAYERSCARLRSGDGAPPDAPAAPLP